MENIKICPNCGGEMTADPANGKYYCPHCDTVIEMDESDEVKKERIRMNALASVAEQQMENDKEIQREIKKAEMQISKEASKRTIMRILLVFVIIAALAGFFIIRMIGKAADEVVHRNDIRITETLMDYEGMDYETVQSHFIDRGFVNVTLEKLEDLGELLKEKDGLVEKVLVGGKESYDKNAWYSPEEKIVIVYHTVNPNGVGGIQPLEDAEYYVGKDYNIAFNNLRNAGFTNIELKPLKDLDDKEAEEEGKASAVSINGQKEFRFFDVFPEEASVTVSYHSLKARILEVGTSAEDFIKQDYHTVAETLKAVGFYNITYVLLDDAGIFVPKNSVESISINGVSNFLSYYEFEEDAKIVITVHVDKNEKQKLELELNPDSSKAIMPLSAKSMIGKDYKTVMTQLQDAGFTNIETIPDEDLKQGFHPVQKKDGQIESVTVNGQNDFEKNTVFSNDAVIKIVYHTYPPEAEEEEIVLNENEVLLEYSPKDLKKDNYSDSVQMLTDNGFTNVRAEAVKDIDPDRFLKVLNKKDGEVDRITFAGNDKFEKGSVYQNDVEIVVYYHTFKD